MKLIKKCNCVRLGDLKEVNRRHTLDQNERIAELNSLRDESRRLKDEAPGLAERFRFYQDLRGYVTDLVECLDEKVGALLMCLPGGQTKDIRHPTILFAILYVTSFYFI